MKKSPTMIIAGVEKIGNDVYLYNTDYAHVLHNGDMCINKIGDGGGNLKTTVKKYIFPASGAMFKILFSTKKVIGVKKITKGFISKSLYAENGELIKEIGIKAQVAKSSDKSPYEMIPILDHEQNPIILSESKSSKIVADTSDAVKNYQRADKLLKEIYGIYNEGESRMAEDYIYKKLKKYMKNNG